MSLPQFDVQGSLFESLGAIAPDLFADNDKYKLFAKKVWPVLASCREQLLDCYDTENGRPGVEPVVLLGILIFQFLERVPDRQAMELVKYHLGWKLALNLKLSQGGFVRSEVGSISLTALVDGDVLQLGSGCIEDIENVLQKPKVDLGPLGCSGLLHIRGCLKSLILERGG